MVAKKVIDYPLLLMFSPLQWKCYLALLWGTSSKGHFCRKNRKKNRHLQSCLPSISFVKNLNVNIVTWAFLNFFSSNDDLSSRLALIIKIKYDCLKMRSHDLSHWSLSLTNKLWIFFAVLIIDLYNNRLLHLKEILNGNFLFPIRINIIGNSLCSSCFLNVPVSWLLKGESQIWIRFRKEV